MSRSILLINPRADAVSYYGAEVFAESGLRPVSHMLDLSTVTVAGLAPEDFEVSVCDENLQSVDFSVPVDYVGITGKVSQWGRMQALARSFRDRGKTVLIGGPFASLCPEVVRPHCDILVRGEIEEISDRLFDDLRSGSWKPEYVGTTPDLSRTPMPRLDLYPNDRALLGAIQTSRGCPFSCEFCDVIQYQGRRQRHKPIPRVIEELDQLYRHGYRYVFLADDNLTACRRHAKQLLRAIRDWNRERPGKPVGFCAQVSIDSASDTELLQLCSEAGIVEVFVGIETPNKESLAEVKKRQNLKLDLCEQVERFLEHGIKVTGGMIVGFDSDDPEIFERQYRFAMSTPIPLFTLGPLVAPAATPLHRRLKQEGRLVEEGSEMAGALWSTNIVPKQMTREQLLEGVASLCRRLYAPRAYLKRMLRMVEVLGSKSGAQQMLARAAAEPPRPVELECLSLIRRLAESGPAEAWLVWRVLRLVSRDPRLAEVLPFQLVVYMQLRHAFERGNIWKRRWPALRAIHARVVRGLWRFLAGRRTRKIAPIAASLRPTG